MMSSGILLNKMADDRKEKFKLKEKDLFQIDKLKSNKIVNNNNNNNKMVKAVHNKTQAELSKMKVGELRVLIRKHNLHNQIKGYSVMKKAALIESLMKHSKQGKEAVPAEPVEPPKKKKGRPKKVEAPVEPEKKKRGRPKKAAADKFEEQFGNVPSKNEKVPKVNIGKKKKLRPKKSKPLQGDDPVEPDFTSSKRKRKAPQRLIEDF
jgi:hypothetical protein